MPRSKNPVSSYRLHRQSGQAVVTVRTPDGRRVDRLRGKFGTPGSKAEYGRVLAELRAGQPAVVSPATPDASDLTVIEVRLAHLRYADGYYCHPDGTPTSETGNIRDAVRVLKRLYGHTPAREFGPRALKAVRQAMIDTDLRRTVVDGRVNAGRVAPFAHLHADANICAHLQQGRAFRRW